MSVGVVHRAVDPEFKALVPPLAPDERSQLEINILRDGCLDPIRVWNGLIIDGHNRFEICEEHGLDYMVSVIELPDRDAAKIWIIQNQFGRRNLSDYDRGVLALKLKPLLAAKAKENQIAALKKGASPVSLNSTKREPLDTRAEVAKAAGVSQDTIRKIEVIEKEAPESIKEQLRNDQLSINGAYQTVRPKPAEQRSPEPEEESEPEEVESPTYPQEEEEPEFQEEDERPFALVASEAEEDDQDDDQFGKFWRRFERARDEIRMLLNTLMDPDNADLIENLAGASRKAALHSVKGVRDDANGLVQFFRKAGSSCAQR